MLTAVQAAERLGIGVNALRAWVKAGWLVEFENRSGMVGFREADVDELAGRVNST